MISLPYRNTPFAVVLNKVFLTVLISVRIIISLIPVRKRATVFDELPYAWYSMYWEKVREDHSNHKNIRASPDFNDKDLANARTGSSLSFYDILSLCFVSVVNTVDLGGRLFSCGVTS